MQPKFLKLIIAADLGASLTKIFFRLLIEGCVPIDGLKTYYNAVQRITQSRYLAKQYADDNTSLVAYDGDYWMVGSAARHEVAFTNVRTPKQKHAIAKVLAAVGQILSEYGGEALDGIDVELGVLLPLDEMAGDPTLGNRLGDLLFEFGHNGRQVKCAVSEGVSVFPEGYGYAQLADKPTSGVVMIGHRDAAYLHIEKGSICPSESLSLPGWGMVKLIKSANYLFKDELRAAAAIFAAGDTFRDKPLLKLVLPEDLPRVKRELKEARSLVWGQFMDELSDTPIRSNEQIFGAGGNGFYWRPELKDEFGLKLSMGGDFLNEIQARFPELEKSPLLPRCTDCARTWLSLPGMSEVLPVGPLAISGG
jgi:Actin like proteins N terminal domain